MDRELLVKRGKGLMKALLEQGYKVTTATWIHSQENDEWHLVLSTPAFDKEGPLPVYVAIEKVAAKWPDLPLNYIGVVSPSDSFAKRIESKIPPKGRHYLDIPLNPNSSVSAISSSVHVPQADRMIVLRPVTSRSG